MGTQALVLQRAFAGPIGRAARSFAPLLAFAFLIAGCGASGPVSTLTGVPTETASQATTSITVTPATATTSIGGGTVSFVAAQGGAAPSVTWQVNGVPGGDGTVGTISESGQYSPPGVMPSPATVTVNAVSTSDSTASGSASVTLTGAPPATVSVQPTSATVLSGGGTQVFVATVVNSSDTTVVWAVNGVSGGNATVGTISATGRYAAPATPPAEPSVTVTATSVADQSASAAATVLVTAAPLVVSVTVSPSAASVQAGSGSQSFVATVLNGTTNAVTWQVNGIVGGNSAVGTISNAGLYTAPATAPTPATVTVRAVSAADPSQSASAIVTVTPAGVVAVSPAGANVQAGIGTQQFSATVTNETNSSVSWSVNGIAGGNATIGTISASGLYTAPADAPATPTVTVSAILMADPTRYGSANVTITPRVQVTLTPATATVKVGSGTQAFVATVTHASNTVVTWKVNGVPGGNTAVGTISAAGVYQAPATVPSPASVTVSASSVVDPGRPGTATVTITAALAITVSVSPMTANVQAGIGTEPMTVAVGNTGNTAVTWQVNGVTGGNATVGTVSAAGLYQAPSSVPSPAAVSVTAVSVADPTKSGSATLTITPPVSVSVTPASATVQAGIGRQTFTATVSNTANSGVSWQVNGITGGNASVGTVSTAGAYAAPVNVPSPASVSITAVSVTDPTRSGTATVTITAPVGVSVTPASATVQAGLGSQAFAATVANSGNSAVTWQVNGVTGGNATVGTISAAGLYKAPTSLPSPATVTVTAVSVADATRTGVASVTVTAPVTVTVTPTSASVQAGLGSQAFAATVANSANASVTWQVNGVVGGNATVGTITAAGTYKAPSSQPSPASVTVTAVSVADPTRSASATVSITAPVSVSVTPATATAQAGTGSQAFIATVANTGNTTVTWQVNGVTGGTASIGTISGTGLYSAPATVPSPATVTVTAVSSADPTRSGSATLTIIAAVSVTVSPTSASAQAGIGSQTFTATVANSGNTSVTWQVNGVTGGNATVGTISAAGVYKAPATVPSPAAVTVTAVSVADPTHFASASLTITAAVSVTISPTLASASAGSGKQQFTATVTNGATGAVTWKVNGTAGGNATVGTVSAAGLFTAPAKVPSPATVTVNAVSTDDPTKSANATVTITAAAVPPTISGTPPTTATVGKAYSFTPTASGASGVTLTFSIANQPSWATFSAATGQLSGTPTAAAVGTYANISISVSDGTSQATLPPFTITVAAASTGAATLSWVIPTTRTDGTALTNLAGFHVYYGTSPGTYTTELTIANPTISTYVVSSLPSGTYYFVATAYDTAGVESAYTPQASKTIP